jgi:hypothetical protein
MKAGGDMTVQNGTNKDQLTMGWKKRVLEYDS